MKTNLMKLDKSSYWIMDDIDLEKTKSMIDDKLEKSPAYYKQLSNLRHGVSNFVKIITDGMNIPVKFLASDKSFTDSKTVYISSDISNNSIDSTVGLALHEASHIKYSNFKLWINVHRLIKKEIKDKATTLNIPEDDIIDFFKGMVNWIEDRRIDALTKQKFRGYIGYYNALYKRYFLSEKVDETLKVDAIYNRENLQSYEFKIINLINPFLNLDSLKSLRKIYNMIDYKNILRLNGTKSVFLLAEQVVEEVLNSIENFDPNFMPKNIEQKGGRRIIIRGHGISGNDSNGNPIEITEDDIVIDMDDLKSDIQKQKDLINGKAQKKKLSSEDISKLEQLENTYNEVKKVIFDAKQLMDQYNKTNKSNSKKRTYIDSYTKEEYEVSVYRNISSAEITSGKYDFFNKSPLNNEFVKKGETLGNIIGKKLLIRNEDRITRNTFKSIGRIDNKLLYQAGFNTGHSKSIFYTNMYEKFPQVSLHISIDISGSMSGEKIQNAIVLCMTISKAISFIKKNTDITISARSGNQDPYIAILYDSKKDSISKLRLALSHLTTPGTTPEGLTFETILKYIKQGNNYNKRSYFINISDGEPYFGSNYSGLPAALHTKNVIKKIRENNVNVLSYYINDGNDSTENFKIMYGKDARYITPDNILEISKTLRGFFTDKIIENY